jgi:hypothetical protein
MPGTLCTFGLNGSLSSTSRYFRFGQVNVCNGRLCGQRSGPDTRTMLSESERQERTDPIVSSCEQRIQHRLFVSGRGCRQRKGACASVVLSALAANDILVQINLGAVRLKPLPPPGTLIVMEWFCLVLRAGLEKIQ